MRIEQVNIYKFDELEDEAKNKAIADYYELENYPFLQTDLTEVAKTLLTEKNITYKNLVLYYSLSYSQGDGLCFIGDFEFKNESYKITHNGRYYYANSVSIEAMKDFLNIVDEDVKFNMEFQNLYLEICKKLERHGYSILDYRMTYKEFSEFCESNEYEFYKSGEMFYKK